MNLRGNLKNDLVFFMNELVCGLSFIRAAHKLIARKKHINLRFPHSPPSRRMINDYDRFFVTQQELAASKDVKPTNSAQGKRRTIIPHSSLVAAQLQRLALIFVGQQGLENEGFFVGGGHWPNPPGGCPSSRILLPSMKTP